MPATELRIGEVIEAATSECKAQALKANRNQLDWAQVPPLGSFVRIASDENPIEILGVVYKVESGALDTAHRPTALNLTRQQIREQQPQIFDLLKTDFSMILIGYIEKRTYHQFLPPFPPQIHDFVYLCDKEEVIRITERFFFLRTLLTAPASSDELVAATLRLSYQARQQDRHFLLKAGRETASLLKDNYDRLTAILQRIQP